MQIKTENFGVTASGGHAHLYSIENARGMRAVVTDYGAILTRLYVLCPDSVIRDVVLGYDTLPEYEAGGFFGATVGRHANRIAGATFTLDGVEYLLAGNDGGANLHTDFKIGFHKQLWETEPLSNGVRFSRLSPDGEAGFPGNLQISVSYTLDNDNALHILYEGVSDHRTLINLTNHSFFNLAGHDAGSVLREKLTMPCDRFLEITPGRLPTGRVLPVEGTPMDFRAGKPVGAEIDADDPQLHNARGYDHCYATCAKPGKSEKIALVEDPASGLGMEVETDLPGVQFYTANFLPVQHGKGGAAYGPRCALCLETEHFPDSIHHPGFPQCVYNPGEIYRAETVYRFI
jgi:aldose 1-epimerase